MAFPTGKALDRGQQALSMKSQVVNILSFADPVISVAALQLCW